MNGYRDRMPAGSCGWPLCGKGPSVAFCVDVPHTEADLGPGPPPCCRHGGARPTPAACVQNLAGSSEDRGRTLASSDCAAKCGTSSLAMKAILYILFKESELIIVLIL